MSNTLKIQTDLMYVMGEDEIDFTFNAFDYHGVFGNSKANYLVGDSVHGSRFVGNGGADTMVGGAGSDTYIVSDSDTVIVENPGAAPAPGTNPALDGGMIDVVEATVSYTLGANVEWLMLKGSANLTGTGNALNNYLGDNDGDNTLFGGDGNDTISGFNGNDTLVGGAGDDTYWIGSNTKAIVQEDDAGGHDVVWVYEGVTLNLDNFKNVEEIHVERSTDGISIEGARKNTGTKGADYFVFGQSMKARKIADFSVKKDTIGLSKSIFEKLGKDGFLSKDAFWKGTQAHDADDRIIYNKKTGALYYDADGSGDGKAIKFATLDKNLKMTAHDFIVF